MPEKLIAPEFLTVPEAARLCGVSRNTVYSWVKHGRLSAYQTPGRTNLIRPSALVRFMHESGMFVPDALGDMARQDEKLDPPARSPAKGRGAAVLIVEDEPQSRALAFRTFDGSCVVYEAQTGYEALHMLTVHKDISIVLLDFDVPGHCLGGMLAEMAKLRPGLGLIVAAGPASKALMGKLPADLTIEVIRKPVTLAAIKTALVRVRDRLAQQGTPLAD